MFCSLCYFLRFFAQSRRGGREKLFCLQVRHKNWHGTTSVCKRLMRSLGEKKSLLQLKLGFPQDEEDSAKKGAPEFVMKPEDNISIEEGQTIRLTCQVKGKRRALSAPFLCEGMDVTSSPACKISSHLFIAQVILVQFVKISRLDFALPYEMNSDLG